MSVDARAVDGGNAVPRLIGLATAVPEHRLDQNAVERAFRAHFPALASPRLSAVYENAGIAQRYSCVPLEWYLRPSSWRERNQLYVQHAVALLADATQRCLTKVDLSAGDIDTVITVSTTGIATPSLDARLMEQVAFRNDVERLPIFGWGCAGGVLGLSRAAALARAAPDSNVLVLVVELCGLTFRSDDHSKGNIVASALFGDGAAAAVVRCDASATKTVLQSWGEHTWPHSLDVMGWRVEDDGFGVLFSRDIPQLVRADLRAAADAFLARQGLCMTDMDGFICHPGGAKVVDALEAAFDLPACALADTRAVLRDFGNMSAASVLFTAERMLSGGATGRFLMTALGPGFTAAFLLICVGSGSPI